MARLTKEAKEALKLSNSELDKVVGVAGTKYDRRRTLPAKVVKNIKQMAKRNPDRSISAIAKHYGVSNSAVMSTAFPAEWEVAKAAKRASYAKYKYTTVNSPEIVEERGQYKRGLLMEGKKLPIK